MMIKIQRYRCEYCDNEFFDEWSCQSCEDSHAKIKEIEKNHINMEVNILNI